ncbi:hypothetical protein D3C81_513560 [compost metagenome]
MATVFQLFKAFADAQVQRFGFQGVEVFVADGAGKYLFAQFAFECALGCLLREFADISDIHAVMNQEPDNVVEGAVFKPLFQHHEGLLDAQPHLRGGASLLEFAAIGMEDPMLILARLIAQPVGFGDQIEQQADAVLCAPLLIAQEEPELVGLKGFFQLVPFVGDLQLPSGGIGFGAVPAFEEQCPNELVIGQGNLAHVQAGKCVYRIVLSVQFEPNDSGLVQQCCLYLIDLVSAAAEPVFNGFQGIEQVEVVDIAVGIGFIGVLQKRQQLWAGFVIEGEQLLPILFRQPLIEMTKNQQQRGEPLLAIDHFELTLGGSFDHQWLQAIEIFWLGIAAAAELAHIFQQLSNLQRLPAVAALVSGDPEAGRVALFIGEQFVDGFEA